MIASGRLPAEKIGNSFAIRESDLKLLNGRKNGRPKPPQERTPEEWRRKIEKLFGPLEQQQLVDSLPSKSKKLRLKQILKKPPHERTHEEWNVIVDKYAGSVALGPDRSTNKKYMEGFGRDNAHNR